MNSDRPTCPANAVRSPVKHITTREAELRFCRIVMVMHGIDDKGLAKRTGFALGTIRNILSGAKQSAEVKIAIENALDCRIWSTPDQFRDHQRKR